MTDRTAATALRILGARKVLLGTGVGDSLQNVNTTELPDGSLCWVTASLAFFALHKGDNTTPPDGTNVIEPGNGPGRWFIQTTASGLATQVENMVGTLLPVRPLLQTEGLHPVDTGTAIALLDGEVDALAYPSLSAAVAANPGRTVRLINVTHVVDADLSDPTITLRLLDGAVLVVATDRTIAANVDLSDGGIILLAAGVTLTHTGSILAADTQRIWDADALGAQVLGAPGIVQYTSVGWFGAVGDDTTDSTRPLEVMHGFWVSVGGGRIKFPPSPNKYLVTNGYWTRCAPGATSCYLELTGATIQNTAIPAVDFDGCPLSTNLAIFAVFPGNNTMAGAVLIFGQLFQSASAGDLTITLVVVGDIVNFAIGKRVCVHGFGTQNASWPPNERYFEYHTIASIDALLGTITFNEPLQFDYDSRWSDNFTPGPVGAPRVISLDRDDFTWGEELVIDGGTFVINPNWHPSNPKSNGRLQLTGYRKITVRDVTAPSIVPQMADEIVFQNVRVPGGNEGSGVLEFDKFVRSIRLDGGDIAELQNGFGVLNVDATGVLIHQFTAVGPRRSRWKQCQIHGDGNGAGTMVVYLADLWATQRVELIECTCDTSQIVPSNLAGMVFSGSEQSLTVDSVPSNTKILVSTPTQTQVQNIYRSLEIGRTITQSGADAPFIFVTSIYNQDATHVAIEGEFSSVPVPGDIYHWVNIAELDVDIRDDTNPGHNIVPIKGVGSSRVSGAGVYGDNRVIRRGNKDLRQPASGGALSDETLTLDASITKIRFTVFKAYSGADALALLKIFDADTLFEIFGACSMSLKAIGNRELTQWWVANVQSGDSVVPLESTKFRRIIIRISNGATYLNYTDPTELPSFFLEIDTGRPQ